MKILILLALTGCSFMTLDQQYDEAVACEIDCDELWQAYAKREKHHASKVIPECPNGTVLITDGRYATRLGGHSCVSRADAYRMLRRLGNSKL